MRTLFLLLLLGVPQAHAQMYKCVDARGVTQYSDKPCPDGKGKEVDIRGQPPISGKAAPAKQDFKAAERDFQRRQIERDQEEAAAARVAQEQKRRCGALRAQLDILTRYNTISKTNEKGERVYMDDATRNAQIGELKGQIDQHCR